MHCNISQQQSFSDLVAAQQRLANSATWMKWENRIKVSSPAAPIAQHYLSTMAFSALWGAGLFAILEADALAVQCTLVAALVTASFALDRFFASR